MQKIPPFLWFDNQAEEAMNFYVSIFKNSKVLGCQSFIVPTLQRGNAVPDALRHLTKQRVATATLD